MRPVPELRPIDTGTPPRQYPTQRRCGCGSFLSRYNPSDECRLCECRRVDAERMEALRVAMLMDEPFIRPLERR